MGPFVASLLGQETEQPTDPFATNNAFVLGHVRFHSVDESIPSCESGHCMTLRCAFATCLKLPRDLKSEKARKLHPDFHVEAGRVLTLALSGRRLEAMEAIETTSDFTRLSGPLAFTLSQWRFKLAKAQSGSAAG